MKTLIYYLFGFVMILTGCSKGGSNPPVAIPDTAKPSVTITKPTAGQSFTAGNTILFQATFTDNEKLKSYEVAVTKKIAGGMVLKVVPTSTPFTYTKSAISLVGGKSQDVSLSDITIPANTVSTITTPGIYNLKVTCFDNSDNSASTTLEISIN